jgi:MFS family permease
MESTFALLSEHRYGLTHGQVGRVFGFIGIIIAIVQGGLIGPLTRRFGERRLLVFGLVAMGVAFVALPFAPGLWGLLVATVPLAAGNALANPSMSSMLSRSARPEDQGGTLGIGQSASALGRVLGPVSATWTFEHLWFAGPYVGGAVIMGAMALVAASLRDPGARGGPVGAEAH